MAHHNPKFGILSIPLTGFRWQQTVHMKPREILAANFKKLRAAFPNLSALPDITKMGGGTNGTLGRIANAESAISIDGLEPLAQVYGLEPWQLLVPTLEAKRGALGRPSITGLPTWPLPLVSQARFEALSPELRAYVQGKLNSALDEAEMMAASYQTPAA